LKAFAITLILAVLMTGCTNFTLQPDDTPPQTQQEKLVKAQQEALKQQQQTTLNE
jgi:dihydroorotase-like cyclic amidohydrolase